MWNKASRSHEREQAHSAAALGARTGEHVEGEGAHVTRIARGLAQSPAAAS